MMKHDADNWWDLFDDDRDIAWVDVPDNYTMDDFQNEMDSLLDSPEVENKSPKSSDPIEKPQRKKSSFNLNDEDFPQLS